MLVFLFLSLFYTPREACEPEICENLRILLCVLFLFLAFYCFLDLNFFSISSLLDVIFFSYFSFDFSTSSCYFHPVYFFLGSMWSSRFLWRLVQRTACI